VGKSTLFNLLTRTRKALVRNEPGVTRDFLIDVADWWGHQFEVVDTGGVTESKAGFSPQIRERVLNSLNSFDLLVVICDARAGVIPEDREIIRFAKESGRPFLLVVNKVDKPTDVDLAITEFHEFGLDFVAASFENQHNVDQIVEWIIAHLKNEIKTSEDGLRLTIIGKPNVGKSSFCNLIIGEGRQLVSETAGTTVDAVELKIHFDQKPYILVDTAGLRKASRRQDGVEYLSAHMSQTAVRRSDIVLLLIDANEGPTLQDAKLVEMCLNVHKAVILVMNKMDLAEDPAAVKAKVRDQIGTVLRFFPDIMVSFISAKTGAGVVDLFRQIDTLAERLKVKITTSKLNKFFFEVIRKAPAPVWGTTNVKFYYLVQTEQVPPSFIAFANFPDGVTPPYRRFLSKRLKEEFSLQGVPVRIFVMSSHREETDRRREGANP
jgi:GTP-binding protein